MARALTEQHRIAWVAKINSEAGSKQQEEYALVLHGWETSLVLTGRASSKDRQQDSKGHGCRTESGPVWSIILGLGRGTKRQRHSGNLNANVKNFSLIHSAMMSHEKSGKWCPEGCALER